MLRSAILLPLLVLASSAALGDDASRKSSIGYASVDAALTALRSDPDANVRIESGWTVVSRTEGEKATAIWSFTPEGHPAHPSAVKRIIFEKAGGVYVETKALCQASKKECDKLMEEFAEMERRLKERVRQAPGN